MTSPELYIAGPMNKSRMNVGVFLQGSSSRRYSLGDIVGEKNTSHRSKVLGTLHPQSA